MSLNATIVVYTKGSPAPLPINITVPDKFINYANILIDNVEGGYYNPEWHYKSAMKDSGETMFGMDRKNGKDLFVDGIGKVFWDVIDLYKTQDKWKHGYMAKGESFEKNLRLLATQIMYDQFIKLSKKWLKNNTSIVTNDDCLALHFFFMRVGMAADVFRNLPQLSTTKLNVRAGKLIMQSSVRWLLVQG